MGDHQAGRDLGRDGSIDGLEPALELTIGQRGERRVGAWRAPAA
jgi:hypothetical protein